MWPFRKRPANYEIARQVEEAEHEREMRRISECRRDQDEIRARMRALRIAVSERDHRGNGP